MLGDEAGIVGRVGPEGGVVVVVETGCEEGHKLKPSHDRIADIVERRSRKNRRVHTAMGARRRKGGERNARCGSGTDGQEPPG